MSAICSKESSFTLMRWSGIMQLAVFGGVAGAVAFAAHEEPAGEGALATLYQQRIPHFAVGEAPAELWASEEFGGDAVVSGVFVPEGSVDDCYEADRTTRVGADYSGG